MLTVDLTRPTTTEATIATKGGDFTLILKPPTFGDELAAFYGGGAAHRVLASVVGWRGVKDASGGDVPFSHEALALVIRQTGCLAEVTAAVETLYAGPSEDHLGNSAAPRNAGSVPASVATSTT